MREEQKKKITFHKLYVYGDTNIWFQTQKRKLMKARKHFISTRRRFSQRNKSHHYIISYEKMMFQLVMLLDVISHCDDLY